MIHLPVWTLPWIHLLPGYIRMFPESVYAGLLGLVK